MLRLIGDVHGKFEQYIPIAQQAEYSIQLGDLGFEYDEMSKLDSKRHKVIAGNHDNYEKQDGRFVLQTEHFLGDYGIYEVDGKRIFFIRGGRSIDKESRMEGYRWWRDEELTYVEATNALGFYMDTKPDFVISHECPVYVVEYCFSGRTWNGQAIRPSMTANLLQTMFENHQPKEWFFGHHHRNLTIDFNGTNFHCLKELSYCDIP